MYWPRTPIERLGEFEPSFCPRPACLEHTRTEAGFRFQRWGDYATRRGRRVPRFRCLSCRHTFSLQTFAVSYYLKQPALIVPAAAGLVAGSANRQIARSLGCAPSTVSRLLARLGRHAMLLHARALRQRQGPLDEPVVLDHFETFEFTQDYPFGVATVVGARSWFVYALDPAPHGRAGRLSEPQRRRFAARPRRNHHGGYLQSCRRVLDTLVSLAGPNEPIEIRGDGHSAYDGAVESHTHAERFTLRRYPNPPRGPKGTPASREARVRDAALFPVDLLHKILRHTLAHQRRETIAFARRVNAEMERLALAGVWRNFVKRSSERRSGSGTPAMAVGLAKRVWRWEGVFSRRLFFGREQLPEPWGELYRREWETPLLAGNTRHALARAF